MWHILNAICMCLMASAGFIAGRYDDWHKAAMVAIVGVGVGFISIYNVAVLIHSLQGF